MSPRPLNWYQNWYVQNMICGFKTAFFIGSARGFSASWHAIAAVMASFFGIQLLMEIAAGGASGELNYYWYHYLSMLFILVLGLSYLIGSLACRGGRVLDFMTAFLYSFFFVFIIFAAPNILADTWFAKTGLYGLLQRIIPVWSFLIGIRIACFFIPKEKLTPIFFTGLLFAAATYTLHYNIYMGRFFYAENEEEDTSSSSFGNLTSEEIFEQQPSLREAEIAKIAPSRRGQTDIYALTLALYPYQDVFMRDVHYAAAQIKEKLRIEHPLKLINHLLTVKHTPLASQSNLRFYLNTLAKERLQPEEDIVLLFLTSHGDKQRGLSIGLDYSISLMGFSPEDLKKTLADSGIKNRIIIISACHSGAFIPVLQDENTIIITAAHKDKTSFGCSNDAQMTFFTEAFFKDGMSQTTDIEKAFEIAKASVLAREKAEKIKIHSDPQIFIGAKIKEALKKYKPAKLVAD